MLAKELFFERLPDPDFNKEVYSVSSHNDNASNHSAIYLRARRHLTTQEAVNNLRNGSNGLKRVLGIGGHGAPGFVETGAGPSGSSDENQYIYAGNQSLWADQLERFFNERFNEFVIYSCSTGANRSGAHLLWLIAKHAEKQVIARTGLLYAVRQGNKYWFETEKGATWQRAHYDMIEPPEPIDTPHQFLNYRNPMKSFEYFDGNILVVINFSEVHKIEVIDNNKKIIEIDQESYFLFLDRVFYTEGISIEGEILGIVSKQIFIYFKDKKLELSIYEDRFCKFVGQPIGYYLSEDLKSLISFQ
ncbi:hypothetical protein ACFOWU_09555 [Epilithonimonas zeae]|uniref:DUF4347 domain-containing protein n=1 Tax=Epilithonimonas zeae TaxID=1416779 RepID=A0A1N6GQV2_9FLAO|nr:hypothetical protein [Epilithonimonas zeae]SIO09898.1 hypothetical protein SAMN05444409_1994 [Epilithonimonas zeae]